MTDTNKRARQEAAPTTSPRAYIFDFGGTLDTAGCHWACFLHEAYHRCGVPVGWEPFRQAYVFAERRLDSNNLIEPSFTLRRTLDIKIETEMEWLRTMGYWYASPAEFATSHAQVLTYIYNKVSEETARSREVLLRLPQPKVLVTNFYGNMNAVLAELGLDDMFQAVIESATAGIRKPDARIFALGIEALGVAAADVTVVGDSMKNDILPAKSLGCRTVWLRGEQWDDTADDVPDAADSVITSLNELLPHDE